MSKVKIKNWATVVSLLVILLAASIMAYFSSADAVTNRFNAQDADIELYEEAYDDVAYKVLASEQKMAKNPWVKNTGHSDMIVFLEVEVPVKEVTLVDASGNKLDESPTKHEVFNFLKNGGTSYGSKTEKNYDYTLFQYSSNWILLEDYPQKKTETSNIYVFGYTKRLKYRGEESDKKTDELFDHIQLKSIVEQNNPRLTPEDIKVTVHAIQADNVNNSITETTDSFDETVLNAVYTQYFTAQGNEDGDGE